MMAKDLENEARAPRDETEWTERFAALPTPPPPDLVDRVMAALPPHPGSAWRRHWARVWPDDGRWLAPTLAGAAAAAAVVIAAVGLRPPAGPAVAEQTGVTFVVHAPAAEQVELVGSFNAWQTGQIQLAGPDATGRWTVTVPLPEGRHEYLFLVDGEQWITDPAASFFRPDGFGNRNAVIDVGGEAS